MLILQIYVDDNMFLDPQYNFSKKGKDNWNWFFADTDGDGVLNGVDCKPYNKKKQDGFPAIQQSATSYFKIPSKSCTPISSGPNQNISIAPKVIQPSVSFRSTEVKPSVQINYTDTNKKYLITPNAEITDENGVKVNPIYRQYNPITKTGGGIADYYRGDLNPAAGEAIQKGYDVKAIEQVYDTHPLYPINNAKSIAAAAAKTYLQNNGVKVTDVNESSKIPGQAAYYDGHNIKMYKEAQSDYNGLYIHETVHAIQNGNPINSKDTKQIYNAVYTPNKVVNSQPNITGNNINGSYISIYTSEPVYKNINTNAKQREIEAYYIQNYYNNKEPRNKLVDDFERKLDINTARQLTPEQQTIYKGSSDILVNQAKEKNDMTTGIFKSMAKQKSIFSMNL